MRSKFNNNHKVVFSLKLDDILIAWRYWIEFLGQFILWRKVWTVISTIVQDSVYFFFYLKLKASRYCDAHFRTMIHLIKSSSSRCNCCRHTNVLQESNVNNTYSKVVDCGGWSIVRFCDIGCWFSFHCSTIWFHTLFQCLKLPITAQLYMISCSAFLNHAFILANFIEIVDVTLINIK